jgi:hypothetical protein
MQTKMAKEIKERPILFSSEMVKAILGGRKSQTRRVLKVPKSLGEFRDVFDDEIAANGEIGIDTSIYHNVGLRCPFGKVGDRLWVRETWADVTSAFDDADEVRIAAFKADSSVYDVYGHVVYLEKLGDSGIYVDKWKPSIFMPKFASRITIEITGVRVQHLQQISPADLEAEGFYESHYYCDEAGGAFGHRCTPPRDLFQNRWDWMNARRGYSWESNPFVWVIEFKKLEAENAE